MELASFLKNLVEDDDALHQTSLQRKEPNIHTGVPMTWKEARRHPWLQGTVHLHIDMMDDDDSNFVTSQINESVKVCNELKFVTSQSLQLVDVTSQICSKWRHSFNEWSNFVTRSGDTPYS